MSESEPVDVGDTFEVVQLGLCAGGLVRTWNSAGDSALWAVDDPGWLLANQAVGRLARTTQDDGDSQSR
ncbi:hypothetical protein [Dietzia sp. 179-F 9C3 NHS]|uniref:hypothetical protein n=1 Tax=Dietzia sp. 179-F 9C3 NHS TaxID=3374295 RepID=UPI00387A3DBF